MHSIMQPSSHMSLACPLRRNGFVSHVAPSFPRLRSRPTCAAACGAIRLRLHDVQLLNTVCRRPRRAALFLTKCVLAASLHSKLGKNSSKPPPTQASDSGCAFVPMQIAGLHPRDTHPSRTSPGCLLFFRLQPTLPLLFILMICTPFPCHALPDGSPKEAFN